MKRWVIGGGLLVRVLTAEALDVTVINTMDSGAGSFRQAILDVNAAGHLDSEILFAIPGGPPVTITVTSAALPAITQQVTIDGTTQPGWNVDAMSVVLRGPSLVATGLVLAGPPSRINGLRIEGFTNSLFSAGLVLATPGHQIRGNHFISNRNGIVVASASNIIGGRLFTTQRNVISGNLQAGIFINNGSGGHNTIQGNLIGLGAGGTSALPNVTYGIANFGTAFNTFGGTSLVFRNIISGNTIGLFLDNSGSSNNVIRANYFGTDQWGSNTVANSLSGIQIGIGRNNVIGGTNGAESRNVISGNGQNGVSLGGPALTTLTVGNTVIGNYIGLNASGTAALGNGQHGVAVLGGSSNRIGGTAENEGNVISGNAIAGVYLPNTGTVFTTVQGNRLGPMADGLTAAGGGGGVFVAGARDTLVGGYAPAARNVIAGHTGRGVTVENGAERTEVAGNYIGLRADGLAALGNGGDGINIAASSHTVVRSNVISGNAESGIEVVGSNAFAVSIQGNIIGASAPASDPVANGFCGIALSGAAGTLIGGTNSGDGNRIAFNAPYGIQVLSNAAGPGIRNAMLGNLMYSNAGFPRIELGAVGNDPAPDADSGPNNWQNFPLVTNAQQGSTILQGYLVSGTSELYRCEFFALNVPQGSLFLGATNVMTPPSGTAVFSFVFASTVPASALVVATATDTNGNTSEYSLPEAVVAPAADSDGDGMWDVWEQANFGTLSSNGSGNADGDAYNNYEEFIADTQPTAGASYFEMAALTNTVPHYPSWFASAARWYDVEFTTNLIAPTWINIGTNLVGTSGIMSLSDGEDRTQRIYRVKVKLPQ